MGNKGSYSLFFMWGVVSKLQRMGTMYFKNGGVVFSMGVEVPKLGTIST